jgi:hypothetical protein
MIGEAPVRSGRELQMLEAMVDCAHALGMAFGEAAKAEAEVKDKLALFDAFNRSFLAVRMGIRLSLALRQPPKPARTAQAPSDDDADRLDAAGDRSDRDDAADRDRDRDYEPVSLPRFLATLGVVAKEAGRLGDRLPEAATARVLPQLQALLVGANAEPAAAAPARTAAPKGALLGSTSAAVSRPTGDQGPRLPRPPPRPSG